MRACLFPCQGFQHEGMGEGLFDAFPQLVEETDDTIGRSLKALCLSNPDGLLNQTAYAQVALYAVSSMSWLARSDDPDPAWLAGHSVGEYAALFAAGSFDYGTGLALLRERGRLTQTVKGGMAGVFGLAPSTIEALVAEALPGVEMASYNAPDMTVVAGPIDRLEASQATFEAAGCEHFMLLSVSGPFHSSLMSEAQQTYGRFLDGFTLSPPQRPLVSSVTGRPYPPGGVKQTLMDQFTHPVRWTTVIGQLIEAGVTEFEIMGPGAEHLGAWVDDVRAQAADRHRSEAR